MNRITSLESLRGLLAIWVVLGHTVTRAGYQNHELGLLRLFAFPSLAVDVFIILSGFVIFFLLDQSRPTYPQFIIKRWFRLAPIYLAVLLVSVLSITSQTESLAGFPFKNQAVLNNLAISKHSQEYFWPHVLAHLTMLHGLISDALLPSSSYAFIDQAWSISVEWQFYLVAPCIAYLVWGEKWKSLSTVLLSICVLRWLNYAGVGFAVNQSGYFLVGIVSYYVWRDIGRFKAGKVDAHQIEMLALLAICASYLLIQRSFSLIIWLFVFSSVLGDRLQSRTLVQNLVSKILDLALLRWLGKISYSVYMVHVLVLAACTDFLRSQFPAITQELFLSFLLPSVLLGTLAVSALTYHWIERPGIDLGARLGRRW